MSGRDCAYCPDPGADVCVRVHVTSGIEGTIVYAHTACAERRGDPVLYRVTDDPAAAR